MYHTIMKSTCTLHMQQIEENMKKYLSLLKKVDLFADIGEDDLSFLLQCLDATVKTYPKDSIIFLSGSKVNQIGILLSGQLQVIREDIAGNRSILTEINPGELFAEAFVCAEVEKSPVTVLATTPCEVLMIQFRYIFQSCHAACEFHSKLIENMMLILASKNMQLTTKIRVLSQRTTREKIMEYLFIQAERAERKQFTIPFSRNELADFLCVDRSAMSRELSRMQDDGLIKYDKNKFELLL